MIARVLIAGVLLFTLHCVNEALLHDPISRVLVDTVIGLAVGGYLLILGMTQG